MSRLKTNGQSHSEETWEKNLGVKIFNIQCRMMKRCPHQNVRCFSLDYVGNRFENFENIFKTHR